MTNFRTFFENAPPRKNPRCAPADQSIPPLPAGISIANLIFGFEKEFFSSEISMKSTISDLKENLRNPFLIYYTGDHLSVLLRTFFFSNLIRK